MNIEHVRNTPTAKKQQGSFNEAVRVSVENNSVENNKEVQAQETVEAPKVEIKDIQIKAFFAVTEDENVVIRIVDSDGNLIRQIPPEEFIKMVEFLKKHNENLFSMEV